MSSIMRVSVSLVHTCSNSSSALTTHNRNITLKHHLYNWYAPEVQKFVVRILFMVPLYSVQSWLSLRFHVRARVYIDTVSRERFALPPDRPSSHAHKQHTITVRIHSDTGLVRGIRDPIVRLLSDRAFGWRGPNGGIAVKEGP